MRIFFFSSNQLGGGLWWMDEEPKCADDLLKVVTKGEESDDKVKINLKGESNIDGYIVGVYERVYEDVGIKLGSATPGRVSLLQGTVRKTDRLTVMCDTKDKRPLSKQEGPIVGRTVGKDAPEKYGGPVNIEDVEFPPDPNAANTAASSVSA